MHQTQKGIRKYVLQPVALSPIADRTDLFKVLAHTITLMFAPIFVLPMSAPAHFFRGIGVQMFDEGPMQLNIKQLNPIEPVHPKQQGRAAILDSANFFKSDGISQDAVEGYVHKVNMDDNM